MNVPGCRRKFRTRSPPMGRRLQIENPEKAAGPLGLRIKLIVFAYQARLIFKGGTTLGEQVA